jgi:nucleolar GTP-binding protein
MYVSQPKRRDSIERPSVTVDLSLKKSHSRPNIAKLEEENGGAGVFNIPLQEHYIIPENWKYDAIPEIYNGKNIGDFVDKDIWERLEEIEKEEDLLLEM